MDDRLERVVLVDANDAAIGTAPKLDAHRQGLLHWALSVVVRDPDGRLLLQKRHARKYRSGGLWTNTCCSHPRPDEPVALAAARRLEEEMGFACAALTALIAGIASPAAGAAVLALGLPATATVDFMLWRQDEAQQAFG